MVRLTLNILEQNAARFLSVSGHFGTLCIKGLTADYKTKLSGVN